MIGVWYSLPDVVASRRARGWIEAGLLLANAVVAGWATRVDDDNDDDDNDLGTHTVDASADSENAPDPEVDLSRSRPSGRSTVAAERAIHQWGARRL